MPFLAEAFARLRMDTSAVGGDIERGIRGAGGEAAARRKGKSISEAFSRGFSDGGSTFGRVAASMAARGTIAAAGVAAITPAVVQLTAALVPAAGAAAALPAALASVKIASATTKVAVLGVGDAIEAGFGDNAEKAAEELKGLSREARQFAVGVISLRAPLSGLQRQIANRFFAPLNDEIRPLARTYLPLLRAQVPPIAAGIGNLGAQAARTARTGPVIRAFNGLFGDTRRALDRIRDAVRPSIIALAEGIRGTSFVVPQLAGYVVTLSQRLAVFMTRARETGQLRRYITDAITTIRLLIQIFGNLGATARGVFQATTGGAGNLLVRLRDLTASMRAWVQSARGSETLTIVFQRLADLGASLRRALAGVLPQVAAGLRAGAGPAAEFADAAADLVIALGPLIPALAQASAVVLRVLTPALRALAGWLERNEEILGPLAAVIVGVAVAGRAYAVAAGVAAAATRVWAVATGVASAASKAWTAITWLSVAPVHAHTAAMRLSRSMIGTWIGVKAIEARAWLSSVAGSARATAGVVAHRIALLASTVATKAHAAATVAWAAITGGVTKALAAMRVGMLALNAAMRANPIGAVITAITLLVGALVYLYRNNETVRRAIDAAWKFIQRSIKAVADWFTGTILPSLRRAYDQLVTAGRFLQRMWDAAWRAVSTTIRTNYEVARRIFLAIVRFVTQTLPNAFRSFVNAGQSLFTRWRTGVSIIWNWVRANVFERIRAFVTQTIPNAFRSGINVVLALWARWRTGVRIIWDTVRGYFDRLRTYITQTIPNAFRNGVTAMTNAWNRLREAARRPVAFVVNSVINPLIGGFNRVSRIFNGPQVNPIRGFASGGQIPGAPSNNDNRIATVYDAGRRAISNLKVATGEFIVNTKSTLANLPLIQAINRARGKVRLEDVDPYLDGRARGGAVPGRGGIGDGIGDWLKDRWSDVRSGAVAAGRGISSVYDKVVSGLRGAANFVTNPKEAIARVANAALSRVPGGGLLRDTVLAMGRRVISGLTGKLDDIGGGGLGGGSVKFYQNQMRVLRAAFPGLRLISGFRPGARTLSGAPSYHGLGRAVDVPPIRAVAQFIRTRFGRNTKELISPFNDLNLHNGRPRRWTGAIWNQHNFAGGNAHIHWAMRLGGLVTRLGAVVDRLLGTPPVQLMDRGGTLRPGLNTVYNGLGRNEELVPAGTGGIHVHFHDSVVASERAAEDMVVRAVRSAQRKRRIP